MMGRKRRQKEKEEQKESNKKKGIGKRNQRFKGKRGKGGEEEIKRKSEK